MAWKGSRWCCATGLLLALGGEFASALEVGTPQLISHTPSGAPTSGYCYSPVLSDHGRYTAFTCQSADVIPGEPGIGDLLRHDARTELVVGIGLANDGSWGYCQGAEIGTCSSTAVAASEDGGYVALNSGAPLTQHALGTVFLRNVTLATTLLLTPNPAWDVVIPYESGHDALFGRSEVLFSATTNFIENADANGEYSDLYIKNWVTGAIELVSTSNGTIQGDGNSVTGVLSPDGRYVVFESTASPSGDNPRHFLNLFLRDRVANTTRRLTFPPGGGEFANSPVFLPSLRMTADNRHVLFTAEYEHFAPGDEPFQANIYLLDLSTNTIRLLPETTDGRPPNGPSFWRADISADGRYLVFVSAASNITPATVALPAIFVQDLQTGATVNVNAPLGALGFPYSSSAPNVAISRDGTKFAFEWPTYDPPYNLHDQQIYTVELQTQQPSIRAVPATSFPVLLALIILLTCAARVRGRSSS